MVEATAGQQLLVSSALNDAMIVDHQHLVRFADGAQPVGDDERGAPLQQPQQRLLDLQLREANDAKNS